MPNDSHLTARSELLPGHPGPGFDWTESCRALLHCLADPAWIKDRESRYLAANDSLLRLLCGDSAGPDAVVGKTDHAFLPEPLATEYRSEELRVLAEGREIRSEVEVPRPDGSTRWLRITRSPLRDPDGRVVGTVGVARDLTEERARERRLLHAERLATLGALLSGVAHELNNPLNTILNFSQLLLMDARCEEDGEALRTMQREAERAAGIVSDLRLIARQAADAGVETEPVDLNEAVRHVLKLRRYTLATRSIEVGMELAPDPPLARASRLQVEQVLLNLIINAEQALAERPTGRCLWVRTALTAEGALLEVADNGPGIPAEHLDRVFEPFFTTKPPGEGLGLGLCVVRGIVREHGGEVRIVSRPGAGAAFGVLLPPAVPVEEAPPGPTHPPRPERPLQVLVVDDETSIRDSVARFLERRGHRVDSAADGAEALALLEGCREGAEYDVILSDLRMPGLDGEQLLERLRGRRDGLDGRVVFMTGDAACSGAARILDATGAPALIKPVLLQEIARAVERFCAPEPTRS